MSGIETNVQYAKLAHGKREEELEVGGRGVDDIRACIGLQVHTHCNIKNENNLVRSLFDMLLIVVKL